MMTSNNKSDFDKIWFQNKSVNKTNSNFKDKNCNNFNKKDLEKKQSGIKQAISPKIELKWNQKREQTL